MALEDQAQQHVLDFQIMSLELSAVYGLSTRLALDLNVPFRVSAIKAEFIDGQQVSLPNFTSIHHRDEVIAGFGDLRLSGRYRVLRGNSDFPLSLDLRLGTTIPSGGTEPNPFELGRQGERHQHLFYGSGTFDPLAGLEIYYNTGGFALMSWTSARLSVYENGFGYRGRSSINAGLGVAHSLGLKDWRFRAQMIGRHETPAQWSEQDARNSGLSDLLASLGIAYMISPRFLLNLDMKKTVFQQSRGGQLQMPGLLGLGLSYSFDDDAATPSHEPHAHDALTPIKGEDIDVSDAALAGASYRLQDVLVLGKVTVLDYWAAWCHPCEHIAQTLSQLASQDQKLAVRKIEVPDFDGPVAIEHLKGLSALPIVRIYGPQGSLLHELVGTTEAEVRKRVKAVLAQTLKSP